MKRSASLGQSFPFSSCGSVWSELVATQTGSIHWWEAPSRMRSVNLACLHGDWTLYSIPITLGKLRELHHHYPRRAICRRYRFGSALVGRSRQSMRSSVQFRS
eukprot:2271140-Amphidinium_carterae.1